MAITPPNLTPAVPVMGAKHRQSSNLDKLTTQLNKQTFLTTRQPDPSSSASTVPLVGRLVQQLGPLPSSDQGSGTCCSGQGYKPAYHEASGLSFTTMGQENGFPPTSGLLSQHYVCALEEPDTNAVRTLSPAHQNYISSIHQLHLKVRGGTSS